MLKKAFTLVLLLVFVPDMSAFQKPSKKDYLITIQTTYGEMKAILYEDTPLHRENFLKLVEEGFYDSLLFHRVIEGFMIQGGDPDSKGAEVGQRLGRGGPGYRIDAEIKNNHYHKKGVLAAARTGDSGNPEKRSSGSQFYIVQGKTVGPQELIERDRKAITQAFERWAMTNPKDPIVDQMIALYEKEGIVGVEEWVFNNIPQVEKLTGGVFDFPQDRLEVYEEVGGVPRLDGQYTVFGEVIVGLEVIDNIAAVETNKSNRPIEDVIMCISADRMKKKKITKRYGYAYE